MSLVCSVIFVPFLQSDTQNLLKKFYTFMFAEHIKFQSQMDFSAPVNTMSTIS